MLDVIIKGGGKKVTGLQHLDCNISVTPFITLPETSRPLKDKAENQKCCNNQNELDIMA